MIETKDKSDHKKNFTCSEETIFYSYCLESFILSNPENKKVIEFGTGDGTAVIKAISTTNYQGKIVGYEINETSIKIANDSIREQAIEDIYEITNEDFFNQKFDKNNVLVSNPPYIPADDNNILMPGLYGGVNGNELSKRLIDIGFDKVMLLVASYCDPKEFITYCHNQKYIVTEFAAIPIPFGHYSSEPKVMQRINQMKKENKAFFNDKAYVLAGVLFEKNSQKKDLTENLISSLTSI